MTVEGEKATDVPGTQLGCDAGYADPDDDRALPAGFDRALDRLFTDRTPRARSGVQVEPAQSHSAPGLT